MTSPLSPLFRPSRIAVIGASSNPDKMGFQVFRNIMEAGYAGEIVPVNPKGEVILGVPSVKSASELPEGTDLAVVIIPAKLVAGTMRELGGRKVKSAIVITGGFAESGEAGAAFQEEMTKAAQAAGIRVVGPNCQGVNYPYHGVCASWPLITRRGEIAIVSQSGTVGGALIDWTYEERLGFSAFVREAPGDHPLPLHRRQPPRSHRGHRRGPLPERARRGRGGVRRGDDDLRGSDSRGLRSDPPRAMRAGGLPRRRRRGARGTVAVPREEDRRLPHAGAGREGPLLPRPVPPRPLPALHGRGGARGGVGGEGDVSRRLDGAPRPRRVPVDPIPERRDRGRGGRRGAWNRVSRGGEDELSRRHAQERRGGGLPGRGRRHRRPRGAPGDPGDPGYRALSGLR